MLGFNSLWFLWEYLDIIGCSNLCYWSNGSLAFIGNKKWKLCNVVVGYYRLANSNSFFYGLKNWHCVLISYGNNLWTTNTLKVSTSFFVIGWVIVCSRYYCSKIKLWVLILMNMTLDQWIYTCIWSLYLRFLTFNFSTKGSIFTLCLNILSIVLLILLWTLCNQAKKLKPREYLYYFKRKRL